MVQPTLSLCMIIRDEEKMLPQFLEKSQGLWDELCVVDTGSKDASINLLRDAGAKIEEHPWFDDFAAARNLSLDMATGDWILFLDADEMVTPDAVKQIRGLLQEPEAGAAKIIMRNLMPQGHRHDTPLLRLFRNDPAIRFKCRIHEEVSTSVKEYLERSGKKLFLLSGVIEHLGYVRSVAAQKGKKERDQLLLEQCLLDNPGDLYSHFKLLELAKFWDDKKLLADSAKQAYEQVKLVGQRELQKFSDAGELISLIAGAFSIEDIGRALRFLKEWPQEKSASYLIKRGELFELQGNFSAAEKDFQACLRLRYDQMEQRITIRPHMGLARLAIAQNQLEEAREHVQKALSVNPRDLEALLAMVALSRACGTGTLEKFIVYYHANYGDQHELQRALGEEAFLRGDFFAARESFRIAVEKDNDNKLHVMYAQTLLASGDVDRAHAKCVVLQDNFPEAAAGTIVCSLLKGEDLNFSVEIEIEPLSVALRRWVGILFRSSQLELIEKFKVVAPAIDHLFPWLENYLSPPL